MPIGLVRCQCATNIDDRDRVRPVVNGIREAAERVESGLPYAVDELLGLRLQPGVDRAEAAHDGVQQKGVGQPAWSRLRSTVIVPARSTPIREGRQMCCHLEAWR